MRTSPERRAPLVPFEPVLRDGYQRQGRHYLCGRSIEYQKVVYTTHKHVLVARLES